jgi:aryl-alcohol dehydrogenase-like predicted oxidoreductase
MLELTPLGLGCWAMGGPNWEWGWGAQDDDDSTAAILYAARRGVGWLDTAASYGLGHAERVVGRALGTLIEADRPLVFTKGGTAWEAGARATRRVGDPASIKEHCEASLRRLGVERVDLYQLHWPSDDGVPVEETWQAMAELVDEGKARWIGVCNFDVQLLSRCHAVRPVDTLQTPLSLIDRRSCADVVPWARAHGVAVLAYSPMYSGLLSGGFSAKRARALTADDWRRRDEEFQRPALDRNLALVERLGRIADGHGRSVAELAIGWTLAVGATAAAVGARSPDQVHGWLSAGNAELSASEVSTIAEAVEVTNAGYGPIPGGAAHAGH